VFAELLAVEEHHRYAVEIGAVGRLIARDVELAQAEAELGRQRAQRAHGLLAQVAPGLE